MKPPLLLAAVILIGCLALPAGQVPAKFAGAGDPVLEAMQEEMQRSLR